MFSFDSLHLCYYHKQRENISFGVEFESSARSGEAVTTIGYQVSRHEQYAKVFEGRVRQMIDYVVLLHIC